MSEVKSTLATVLPLIEQMAVSAIGKDGISKIHAELPENGELLRELAYLGALIADKETFWLLSYVVESSVAPRIKKCPFCKGDGKLTVFDDALFYRVTCCECKANGPSVNGDDGPVIIAKIIEAINKWNSYEN